MRSIVALSAVLAGSVLLGQEKPKDVYGWGKIKWGMTIAQARAAYGTEAQGAEGKGPYSGGWVERLVIKNLKVGDIAVDASIASRPGSDRIASVTLHAQGESKVWAYENLKTSLIRKYGRPTHEDRRDDGTLVTDKTTWIFPATAINLVEMKIKAIDYYVVTLQYMSADKKALNTP